MADKKLSRDGSGKLVLEDEVAKEGHAAPVQHSFFEDDEGVNLTSGTVFLDGKKVRLRELSAAEMAVYTQGEKEVGELMVALSQAGDAEQIEALSEQLKARQIANYETVIEVAVGDWEMTRPDGTPVPCTAEMKKRLRPSKKAELCDKIVQRSSLGRDLSQFLTTS